MAHNTTDVQYILSLDSLDLSLLSQFVGKPYKKRMLWSKPFMDGESTYCQVNFASEVIQEEDYALESYKTYMCHICNIDVPQKYFKQHTKSKMHHNFRKLTEKILENLAKQMYFDIDVIENNKHEQTKHDEFCETCCKIVCNTDKQKHNKSLHHLKCVENEKLTEMFIEIYEYVKEVKISNNNETQNNNIQKEDNDRELKNHMDQSREKNIDIENSKKYNEVPINTVLSSKLSSDSKSSLSDYNSAESDDEGSTQSNMSEISNFQLYLKEMIAKYKLQYTIPIIEDNSIVIVTPKGVKEKIAVDNFHGILNNNSFVYCQLCKSWENNYIIHIREEDHVMNIIQPVKDNFAREVVNNEKWDHYLLCNIMVVKGPDHAALYHKTYNEPKTSKIVGVQIKPIETSKQTFCDVCNRYIDTHNFLGHIDGNKHKLNLKQDDSSINIKKEKSNNNKTKEESSISFKKESSSIKKVKSSSDIQLVNNTLKNNDEKISTQKSISVPKSNVSSLKSDIKINHLYCEVCKVNVPKGGMETHEKGKSHNKCAQNINQINIKLKKITKNKYTLNATASGNNLSSSSKIVAVNSTQNCADELTIEGKLLEYYKQMTTVRASELICQVCNVILPDLCKDIIAHVEGTKHKNCFNELLLMYKIEKISIKRFYCKLCDLHIENFIDHIYQDECHKIKFLVSYKIQLKEYLDKDSSNNDPLVSEYRKVYKDMLERSKIERLMSTVCYCHICSILLFWKSEIDHLLNERHQRYLKISTKDTFNSKKSDNDNSSLINISNAAENLLSQQNMKEFTSEEEVHFYKKQMACVGNMLECLVCDVKVANHDKHDFEHVEGSKHKNNTIRLLLKSSIIKKSLNLYYCEICKSHFEDFIDHINKNENHNANIALNKT